MNSKPSNGSSVLKQKKSSLPHVMAKGPGNQQKKSCSVGQEFMQNGKRYLRILDGNTIRDLLLPSNEKNIQPLEISANEFSAIKNSALNHSNEPIKLTGKLKDREELEKEIKNKAESFKPEKPLQENGDMPIFDSETAKDNLRTYQGHLLRHEEKIKKTNSLILDAECRTCRDLQIKEKQSRRETFKKELADFVDCERVETAIRVENENAEKERKKRTFIKCLLDQIEEREETRLTEATNVFFEKLLFNEALTQMEVEEFEKYQKHLKKQADTKAKTEEINAANKALKIIEQQRNKLEELRIIEHVKEADERATEHDRKLKEIREKREKIKEGLFEKLLRDKPNCEYKNESKLTSPWVKEEKDGLIKKIEDIKHFRAGVDKQLQDKAICQANELQRDREDYLKTIKVRDEIMQKELELERRRLKERDAWRTALLHQINEAEKAKIEARKKVCNEKEEMETNIGLWEEIISERIKEKLDEARSNQVSEIYLKNIEREMHIG